MIIQNQNWKLVLFEKETITMSSMKSVIIVITVTAMCLLPLMESKPVKENKRSVETPINTGK